MRTTQDVIDIDANGQTGVLVLRQAPIPEPGPGEVLIAVEAAGVNRADVKQRQGRYLMPPGAPSVPGLEAAGEIARCGPGVTRWQVGDKVCALLLGGGYAQYCVAPEQQCLPVPAGLSVIEAAALPEVAFTSWLALIEQSRMQPGEIVFIHGGTGGVGSFVLQLAAAFGSRVIATAGSAEKCRRCTEFGAALALNYKTDDIAVAVKEFTGGRGVDVIINQAGTSYFALDFEMLAQGGRLCVVSAEVGRQADFDIFTIMAKRLTLTGLRLRPHTIAEKGRVAAELEHRGWPLISAGRIRAGVTNTFPLAQAAAAHALMESGDLIGKLVLLPC
jgi:putative PIG3 family NAD(P)H quinone oxidoreductase